MTVESAAIEKIRSSLDMAVQGVGPEVYLYDQDTIDAQTIPCVLVIANEREPNEAQTIAHRHRYSQVQIKIIVHFQALHGAMAELFDIRSRIESVIDNIVFDSGVVDLSEISTTGVSIDQSGEYDVFHHSLFYQLHTKEEN